MFYLETTLIKKFKIEFYVEFSVEFLQETYLCDKFIPSIWNSVWIVSDIWTSISKSGSNKIIFAPQGVGFVHYPCQVMDSNFQFRLAAGNGENDNKGQILRYLTILVRSETQLYSGW